jgi:vitamin B12/bleomycin/antimicrobial peptide transport system ATP-binding/permease protein
MTSKRTARTRIQKAQDADETIYSLDPKSGISEDRRRRLLLRRFWQSAGDFWRADGGRQAWLLTGVILLLVLLNLAASYGMNVWNRAIFDALEKRDASTVLFLSMVYFPLLAASVCLAVGQVYARMTIQRRWRQWLTHHLFDRWLINGRYYQLHLVQGDHKNPEYRIADDVRLATDSPIDFATGVTAASLSALTFIAVLWTIGGSLSFNLAGIEITIPGFLVVAAVAYAVLASGSMVFIGRRFVTVSEHKNQSEAEFRYVLTRLSENGESIAVLGGEGEERNAVNRSLRTVLRRWRDICFQTMRTTIISQTSSYVAPVLPVLLCAPKFLDGSMSIAGPKGEAGNRGRDGRDAPNIVGWEVDDKTYTATPRFADGTFGPGLELREMFERFLKDTGGLSTARLSRHSLSCCATMASCSVNCSSRF